MAQILLMHGPNLNLLGRRNATYYGKFTQEQLVEAVTKEAKQCGFELLFYQSNHEGNLIDKLQTFAPEGFGIIINPGALTHYSYALYDALVDTTLPIVEVHLSSISHRENWRAQSVTSLAAIQMIEGKLMEGYIEAVKVLAASIHRAY